MTPYRKQGDFEQFVKVQCESALRHVATRYDYDEGVDHKPTDVTLRGGADVVADALREEVQLRDAQPIINTGTLYN